jgi:hypothetical protein
MTQKKFATHVLLLHCIFCRRHRANKKMQFSQQPRKKHVAAVALVLLSSFSYSYEVKQKHETFLFAF